MASSKDRERKLARAKIERQMRNRAESARRQRVMQARIGAGLAVLLIAVGVFYVAGGFDVFKTKTKPPVVDASGCLWTPADTTNTNIKDTGTPPAATRQVLGLRTLTMTTDQGIVTARLDASNAPCAIESMTFLAGKKFFDKTPCHRLTTEGIFVLQCGDPSGTGTGGPGYTFANENEPVDFQPVRSPSPSPAPSASADAVPESVIYPAGTLAMANSGSDNSNGSQFFIVYRDTPLSTKYTVFGKITSGLSVIQKIAKAGVAPETAGGSKTDGPPRLKVTITSLTVVDASSTPSPSPSSPSPSPSTNPSPSESTKS